MKTAITILFGTFRAKFFSLMFGFVVLIAATSVRAQEISSHVEVEITTLAAPWGAPNNHIEGPCLIRIVNKGTTPVTIPISARGNFLVSAKEIFVEPKTSRKYLLLPRRVHDFGSWVLSVQASDHSI